MKGSLPQWLVIMRREFLERVQSKWFALVTLLGPLLMVAMIVIPAYLTARSANEDVRLVLVDESGGAVGAEFVRAAHLMAENIKVEVAPPPADHDALMARIEKDDIDGYLVVPPGVVAADFDREPATGEDSSAVGRAVVATHDLLTLFRSSIAIYRGDNATNFRLVFSMNQVLNSSIQAVRARAAGIPEDKLDEFRRVVPVIAEHTTGSKQATSGQASFFVGYAAMFIIYMAIILYAVNVLRSVVEEKTSRVVEIMVSAAKPRALMLGKIIGVGSVGLFQLAIWAIMALVLVRFREQVLGLFGISGAGSVGFPSIGFADISVVLGYFLFGFFFYASLYAAIGAMVNSDQEAQQAQTPVVILLVIPVLCVQLVANDPRGGIAEVLTLIPFSSPVLMPMRYLLGGATALDVALSLGILLLCIFGTVWVAARIYRVGILMHGKKPRLREVWHWVRHPD